MPKFLPTIGSSGGARQQRSAKRSFFGAKSDGLSAVFQAAYGSYAKGCVRRGASSLADTGPTWQANAPVAHRNWPPRDDRLHQTA